MKIIFIRHGEPNYEIDSLTEKGWREAELLSKRTAKWNVTDFYCSPLGRAKDTASFTLKNADRKAKILPWLREFDAPVIDPETGKRRIPWDFLPDVLDANRDLYDNHLWTKNPIMQTGNMDENYRFVTDGLDTLLAHYGYVRDGYRLPLPSSLIFSQSLSNDFTLLIYPSFSFSVFPFIFTASKPHVQTWHPSSQAQPQDS